MRTGTEEEAIRRDDAWLSKAFEVSDTRDQRPAFQCFCNALPERPIVTEVRAAEPLVNMRGNKVENHCLETEIGRLRKIKMAEGIVLAPFGDCDISTPQGRSEFLASALICFPPDLERYLSHIQFVESAGAVGTLMLREGSRPQPTHFQPRFTHPRMGLTEPDGYCFLFRLEDGCQFFVFLSDRGALLTAPERPFEIMAGKSKKETEQALVDFRARVRK